MPIRPRVTAEQEVWDAGELDYVPMLQPGTTSGGLSDAQLRATAVLVLERSHTTVMGYEGAGVNPVYIGMAIQGAAKTDEAWQIRKLTYDTDRVTDIQYAEGSPAFDKAWNSRASYSYS